MRVGIILVYKKLTNTVTLWKLTVNLTYILHVTSKILVMLDMYKSLQ